ncbi:MAG: ChbG/HpnK family deacetylase [Planctomycetes bacterium]|nr:ChbG/HpnK family deacetylase [Planctomycetota bacterium]
MVIADDFGIGANTTAGILQVAAKRVLSGSAFLVNTANSADAIRQWRQAGASLELGWHPNLTLDSPLASPAQIPTLVQPDGTFWPLGQFLKRWLFGRFDAQDIHTELTLQMNRFTDLVGHPPRFVNFHQHLALFPPVGRVLLDVLATLPVRPYIRRVKEPWWVVATLPGARVKRIFLNGYGRRMSNMQEAQGFPGNDWLAGLTNPQAVESPDFFVRWLTTIPGQVVELMCHPGQYDETLIDRDCTATDGLLQQRVNELRWLQEPSFLEAIDRAGFRLATPSEMVPGMPLAA